MTSGLVLLEPPVLELTLILVDNELLGLQVDFLGEFLRSHIVVQPVEKL